MIIRCKKLHPDAIIPSRARAGDAGFDLHALRDATVAHDAPTLVDTGIAVEIAPGFYGQIFGRSGLAAKGIGVLGGVIDSSYRGSVGVILTNARFAEHEVKAGDRVAQLVILPRYRVDVLEADELTPSERGADGFGSSGR